MCKNEKYCCPHVSGGDYFTLPSKSLNTPVKVPLNSVGRNRHEMPMNAANKCSDYMRKPAKLLGSPLLYGACKSLLLE